MKLKSPGPVEADPRESPVRVVVVDDHTFMRELICARLERDGRYTIVGQAGDAAGAIEQCRSLHPDLLILDINLPDRKGTEIIAEIKQMCGRTRVLLCTAYAIDDPIAECMRAGASGFVEKTNSWVQFLEAVERVSRGESYFANANKRPKREFRGKAEQHIQQPETPLTQREKEVLALVAEGLTSKNIASQLGLSVVTIDTHRANLMSKLGVHNVAGLVVFAVQSGIFVSKLAPPPAP
jgi:DNA-binding NarL/FixJ family response regulator